MSLFDFALFIYIFANGFTLSTLPEFGLKAYCAFMVSRSLRSCFEEWCILRRMIETGFLNLLINSSGTQGVLTTMILHSFRCGFVISCHQPSFDGNLLPCQYCRLTVAIVALIIF